ncbi:hypothetical protein AgCh_006708 [Apium graveolens]
MNGVNRIVKILLYRSCGTKPGVELNYFSAERHQQRSCSAFLVVRAVKWASPGLNRHLGVSVQAFGEQLEESRYCKGRRLWLRAGRSFRGKRILYDEEDELQENDSEFLQSGTMQYQTRDRSSKEQGFFRKR